MRLIFLASIFLFFTACDSNPLGENNISSCTHSPDTNVGLPLTCPIALPTDTNLLVWLDANDVGTVQLQNQTEVSAWIDKSGQGRNFSYISGSPAEQSKKSINDRSTIIFSTATGAYGIGGGLTGFPADQSFTFAMAFRANNLTVAPFEFTNNSNFSFSIESTGEILYSIGTASNIPTGIFIIAGAVSKIGVFYNHTDQVLGFFNGSSIVYQTAITSTLAWSDLQINAANSFEVNELLIYTDTANISTLQVYLNSKWGF